MFVLDEKDAAALSVIFHDAVFFLIKSGNEENVSLAKAKVGEVCSILTYHTPSVACLGRLVNAACE